MKFQLPWRGSTNLTVVSSETERPMYHLGTDRDPVYTDPNEYLPVRPVNTPWSHRANSVTALHCSNESVQILPVSILDFFNERRVVPGFYLSNCAKTCNRV